MLLAPVLADAKDPASVAEVLTIDSKHIRNCLPISRWSYFIVIVLNLSMIKVIAASIGVLKTYYDQGDQI